MNDYGIPIIEPTVDFSKVPPIHQKRTITFVNHFIIQTVTFLNKFALCCEEKLFEFENKLQKVEASLEILESRNDGIFHENLSFQSNELNKINIHISQDEFNDEYLLHQLSSIPEADSPAKTESPIQTDSNNKVQSEEATKPNTPDVVEATIVETGEEKMEKRNMQPISKDPKYAKYFKMVQVGVQVQAVKLKMTQEGLDPLILDNPDEMVPITEVTDTNTTTDDEDA